MPSYPQTYPLGHHKHSIQDFISFGNKEATRADCTGSFLDSANSHELFSAGHHELPPVAAAEDFGEHINDTSFRRRKSSALPAIGLHASTRIKFSGVSRAVSALGCRNGRTSETI